MTEAVLDASVVLKWFHADGERHARAAQELREQFEAGNLRVLAPALLWLELINVAARSWRWSEPQLEELATSLPALGFELIEPELPSVARWTARGLTAYDATYVAVAELTGTQLISDDDQIVRAAPQHTTALSPPDAKLR